MKRHANTPRYITNLKEEKNLMKNKNNLLKFTNIVLFITMIAIILVSGTYAKYTSTASGTSATVVANWSFNVNDKNIAEETFEFNLFDTANIKDSDGSAEEDVAEGLIAPGTSGSFEFALENTSDVTAKYEIKLETENTHNIPIEFSFDGNSWTKDLSDLVATEAIGIGLSDNVTVQWRWIFDGDDTTLGTTAATATQNEDIPSITVTAKIIATQVNYIYTEKLEQQYELAYYSNASQALTVINNSSYDDESLTTTKEESSAAVYMDENNIPNLVILKNSVLDEALEPSSNMILDLAGQILTFNNENAINVTSGDVIINGTVDGSKISLTNGNQKTTLAKVNNGSLTLNGGTYKTTANSAGSETAPNASVIVESSGTLTVDKADIIAEDVGSGTAVGVLVEAGGSAVVSNSIIEVSAFDSLGNDGIRNYGTITLTNTNVAGYGNYTANAAGTNYATNSRGINNEGTMTLKNCNVYGAHSGIRSPGTLYIDGGTYEGYGHGGFYFAGGSTTSYVKNATVRYCDMKVGYADSVAGTNSAGFYIGGGNEIIVYMDNCELYGPKYPAVIRSSGKEANNALYISNSEANTGDSIYIRNDGSTNKVYVGVGNNFTADDGAQNAIDTEVDYSTEFPEY